MTTPTATTATPTVDPARLQQLAADTGSEALQRLLAHDHPLHAGWLPDGPEREDWLATVLMDIYREHRDGESVAMLYELFSARFLQAVRGRLRTYKVDVEAEDLVHEAFAAICRYPEQFVADRPHAFRCWAFRIVYNTVNTAVRKRRRGGSVVQIEAPDQLLQAADQRTPERRAIGREAAEAASQSYHVLLQAYGAAFQQLSEQDQRLLEMVELEHRPYDEIAELLGINARTLRVRVFRARKRVASGIEAVMKQP